MFYSLFSWPHNLLMLEMFHWTATFLKNRRSRPGYLNVSVKPKPCTVCACTHEPRTVLVNYAVLLPSYVYTYGCPAVLEQIRSILRQCAGNSRFRTNEGQINNQNAIVRRRSREKRTDSFVYWNRWTTSTISPYSSKWVKSVPTTPVPGENPARIGIWSQKSNLKVWTEDFEIKKLTAC